MPTRCALLAALTLLLAAAVRAQNCTDPNCNTCNFNQAPGACSTCKIGFGLYGGLVQDAKCCPANIEADANGACTVDVCQDPNCESCSAPATCTTCRTGYQLTNSDGCATLDSDNDGIPDVVEGEVDTGTTTFALFFLFFRGQQWRPQGKEYVPHLCCPPHTHLLYPPPSPFSLFTFQFLFTRRRRYQGQG